MSDMVCAHGQLSRVCNICELENTVDELRTINATQGKTIGEQADELRHLRNELARLNGMTQSEPAFPTCPKCGSSAWWCSGCATPDSDEVVRR